MWAGRQLAAATLLLCPLAAGAAPARDEAEVTTIISSSSVDLGVLVQGAHSTTFHIDANGGVTTLGGDFMRLRGGDVTPQEVQVRCQSRDPDGCRGFRTVIVTVTTGGATSWPGRAGNFSLGAGTLSGAELVSANVGEQASTFVLRCAGQDCGQNPVISFRLALDIRVDPARPGAGAGYYPYNVTAVWQ